MSCSGGGCRNDVDPGAKVSGERGPRSRFVLASLLREVCVAGGRC